MLYGVGVDDVMGWDFDRWVYHKQFAEQVLRAQGVMGGNG